MPLEKSTPETRERDRLTRQRRRAQLRAEKGLPPLSRTNKDRVEIERATPTVYEPRVCRHPRWGTR